MKKETKVASRLTNEAVEDAIRRAFLGGAALRREDAQKVREVLPLLEEIARAAVTRKNDPFVLVDACAGKAALGVLAAALILDAPGVRAGPWQVVAIERVAARRSLALDAASALGVAERVSFIDADVDEERAWPARPDVVVALHACGRASDAVIDRAVAAEARRVLLVPCCYAGSPRGHDGAAGEVAAQPLADAWAARLPLPRHGLVGRRFAQAMIDAERTLRLEAAGYETEVVEVFAPGVSPYNFLWRARRVREPVRMAEARARLDELRHASEG